ncbi:MAG: hypothetical protein ABEJ34_04650 [Haloferacaceae archaeon]
MTGELAVLDPKEVVIVLLGIVGFVPIVWHYRDQSRWFVAGYGLLVVAALSTNLEAFLLGGVFDLLEHGAGVMGSGLAFAAAAYYRRRNVLAADGGA